MNQKTFSFNLIEDALHYVYKHSVMKTGKGLVPVFTILIMLLLFNDATAQNHAFCGTYSTTPASSTNPDSVLIDRFGNTYDLEQLLLPANRTGSATCSDAGYFDPFFLGDPPDAVVNVFCQVLSDLSVLIPQRTSSNACGNLTPQKVNLQVAWINFADPDPGLLGELGITAGSINPTMKGMATSFMLSASDNNCEEVAISRPFAKINGANLPGSTTAYDGRLLLNSIVNWNTNTSAQTGDFPNMFDLYTVIQHEMMHILGYDSRISSGTHFSLWDQSLHIAAPSTPALSNENNCLINCWTVSPDAEELALSSSCDLTLAGIAAVGGDPTAGINANLFSHLNPNCGQDDYLMQWELPSDVSRRATTKELQILCELGYDVPAAGCDGCYNIAQFDYELTEGAECCFQTLHVCAGQPLIVSAADLFCNDITNGSNRSVTRIWSSNPSVLVQDNLDQTWTITVPASAIPSSAGTLFLFYTVKNCDCRLDNARFAIFVEKQCPSCTFSPDRCDNMLCVSDFENYTNTARAEIMFGWPIIFSGADFPGTPDIYATSTGGHYLRLINSPPNSTGNREAANFPLQECVPPGCELTLNMDMSFGGSGQGALEIWGSQNRPCPAVDPLVVPIANNCGIPTLCSATSTFAPVCITTIPAPNGYVDIDNPNFVNSGDIVWKNETNTEVCYLTLVPLGETGIADNIGTFVDNLLITRRCVPDILITSEMPDAICPDQAFNLEVEVCANTTPGTGATDVEIDLNLPSGLTLVTGSNTVNFTLTAPQCTTLVFSLVADSGLNIGSSIEISLSGSATGLCANKELNHEKSIFVMECPAFKCPCTAANTLNIDAGEDNALYDPNLGGTLFSALEVAHDYDKNDDGVLNQSDHNGCIAINGRLIIDHSLTITGCQDIKMQPCAEIVVQGAGQNTPGRQFYLRASRIYGCVGMWKGIAVEAGATLLLRSNSLVADAENAVRITPSSPFSFQATQVNIQNNQFKRNHIGVHIPGSGGLFFGGNVSQAPFIGNTFEATGLLPACTPGLANYQSDIGYAGVAVYGAAFTVGQAGISGIDNYFDHLRFGVIGGNVFLTVNRGKFTNIVGAFDGLIPTQGVGVFGQGGLQEVHNCEFEDCGHAVYSGSAFLSMLENKTDRVDVGLYTTTPLTLDVKRNLDIKFREHGIYGRDLSNIPLLSGYVIDENTFRTQGAHSGFTPRNAIYLENGGGNGDMPTTARISRNYANMTDNIGGFRVINQNRWKFTDNTLDIFMPLGSTAVEYPGIQLDNASGNYLYNNTISDISDVPAASLGFSTNLSQNNKFCCNTTNGGFWGAYFSGACTGTEFRYNTMENHFAPVYLNVSTIISPQGSPDDFSTPQDESETYGNIFVAGCGTATHFGGQSEAPASTFYVTNTNHPHWPDGVDPVNLFEANGAIAGTCNSDTIACPPEPYIDDNPQAVSSDSTVAQNIFGGNPSGDGLQWESERELYARLKRHPELLGNNAVVDAFFSGKDAGSALKTFYEADELTAEVTEVPGAWNLALQDALAEIIEIESDAQTALLDLAGATTEEDSMEVYWDAETIRRQKTPHMIIILETQQMIDSLRRVKALAALPTVLALPEGDILQSNRKMAHQVFLETTATGATQLTATQFSDISDIAHQCPRTGGTAVYLARALYQRNELKMFDDVDLCTEMEERSAVSKIDHAIRASLWPNPSSGLLHVWIPNIGSGKQVQLRIMDPSGKVVQESKALSLGGQLTIDASKLTSGLYFCYIGMTGSVFEPLKFVIAR